MLGLNFKNMKNIFFIALTFIFGINLFPLNNENKCQSSYDNSRVVSVGGSITEILYELNFEKHIVAVDITSNYPIKAKKLPSVGYIRNLSTEGLLSMEPTLIICENDIGPPIVIEQVKKSKVDLRIIAEHQSIDGIIEKIKCVGEIINKNKETSDYIYKNIKPIVDKINEKLKNKKLKETKVMMILSMQGTSPVVAGSGTSGNSFIKMLGAKNIYESLDGWKAVTPESILQLNPDYIILPSRDLHKGSNVEEIQKNILFKNTNAGRNNGFIIDDGMSVLGYGPRTIKSVLNALEKITKNTTHK